MSPKKKATTGAAEMPPQKEPTDLEKVEAEMREISPTLPELKKNDRAAYIVTYRRYMWLVGERDKLKAE